MLTDYLWLENKEKHAMWSFKARVLVVLLINTDNIANFCFEIYFFTNQFDTKLRAVNAI